jgi:hypothetical protein
MADGSGETEGPIPPGWYPEPGNPDQKRHWDGEEWGEKWSEPKEQPTGRANRLAVTALICACIGPIFVGGVLATVFGSVALDEIEEAEGRERGQGMAKWAIGLGFLNIVLSILVIALVIVAVTKN